MLGNFVNLAARIADLAGPGQIYIGERTLSRVKDLVNATEVGLVQLKNVSRQVKVFEAKEPGSGGA